MMQLQELQREFGNTFAEQGLKLPSWLFASGQIACRKFEVGSAPTEDEVNRHFPPGTRTKIERFLVQKKMVGNPLWKNIEMDIYFDGRSIKCNNNAQEYSLIKETSWESIKLNNHKSYNVKLQTPNNVIVDIGFVKGDIGMNYDKNHMLFSELPTVFLFSPEDLLKMYKASGHENPAQNELKIRLLEDYLSRKGNSRRRSQNTKIK